MIPIPEDAKQAFLKDRHKNLRLVFDDGTPDITNSNIIKESLSFDEMTCSESELKFGLCEGAGMTFETVDTDDLTGKSFAAYMDIESYSIPLGHFTVDSCATRLTKYHRFYKVSAYNKLQSKALDADVKAKIQAMSPSAGYTDKVRVIDVMNEVLSGLGIERPGETITNQGYKAIYNSVNVSNDSSSSSANGTYIFSYQLSIDPGSDGTVSASNLQNYINIVADRYSQYVAKGSEVQNIDATKYAHLFGIGVMRNGEIQEGYTPFGTSTAYNVNGTLQNNMTFNDVEKLMLSIPVTVAERYILQGRPLFRTILNWDYSNAYFDPIVFDTRIVNPADYIAIPLTDLPDVTARDIASAYYETLCQFGKLDRVSDLFSGVELNQGGLYPANTLYPSDGLYPSAADASFFRSAYTKISTGKKERFKYLIITYKALDEEGHEIEKTLQRTVNAYGTTNYNMSDNWLFKNIVWTSSEVATFANAMAEKMRNMEWCQLSLDATGLPYIESGDMIEILTEYGRQNTYILSRHMRGIQRLEDTYSNGSVNTF